MMKKKISILTLTILFLVSTIGLPIYSHYCEMMKQKSLSDCEVCMIEMQKVETSCCLQIIPKYQVKISDSLSRCCIDNFDYKKIEDNFFQTITTNHFSINLVIAEQQLSSIDSKSENKLSEQTKYNLPPPKFGKELLYTIHQLKIDLPVC